MNLTFGSCNDYSTVQRGDRGGGGEDGDDDFEGKKPRKSVMRKTVDYNCAFLKLVEDRHVTSMS